MNRKCLPGDDAFAEMLETLARTLREKGWSMATAESCTGGWIAKCCTDLAGSSDWFERGFVTYSNQAKRDLLDVSGEVLESDGAVSEPVALEMARGARKRAGVNVALSVTGIAGPTGGTDEKPVGTVWFGWSEAGRDQAGCIRFDGDRDAVRSQSVSYALSGLLEFLNP